MVFITELKEWGNSYGIRISKKQAQELGLVPKQKVRVDLDCKLPGDGFGIFKGGPSYTKKDRLELEGRQRW
ncbi:MAG: hypothetical protein ABIA93_02355 [Candidatus Woesearchaeota archaeon]